MSMTLESGECPQCRQENSIHISECHNCKAALPWANSAATKVGTEPATVLIKRPLQTAAAVWQIIGTLVVLFGIFL